MKKHNLIKVVAITILVFVLLSWIFPTASYSSTQGLVEAERVQVGFYELFNYPSLAMSYFGYIFVFVLMIGAFYEILSKTGAYRELVDRLVKQFKGRESLFLATTMVILAAITSFTGLSVGLMFVFPFLIALILSMGYGKLTAAATTVGSVMVGLIGTTFGNTSVYYLNYYLGTELTTQIWPKVIILIIGLALLIFNVLKYAKKTKNDVDLVKEDYIPEKVKGKHAIWPLVVIFDLLLIIMVIAQLPWEEWGITLFTDMTDAIADFEVFGFPIFGKILGAVLPFGQWSIFDFAVLLFIAGAVIAFIYKLKVSQWISAMCDGFKKFALPATLMMILYMCLIIATYHQFQLVIIDAILSITSGLNSFTMAIATFLASVFNMDPMYVAAGTVPYVASLYTDLTTSGYGIIAVIYQSMYGLAMLVAPTSVILIGTLAYLKIPYGKWLKHIWKLFVELLVILLIIFTILVLM